jgi:transposase-like protein
LVDDPAADHGNQQAAIQSIAPKIGCTEETPRCGVREAERAAVPGAEARAGDAARVKAPEREMRQLRRANEIPRRASECRAQAGLDRPSKR